MRCTQAGSFTHRHSLRSIWILTLWLSMSWGCGVFRAPVPPGFDTVAVKSEVERNKEGKAEGDLVAFSTTKGVLVGAAIGAPSGALAVGSTGLGISLIACGPPAAATTFLAPITYVACVGVVTIASATGGFVVGLGSGVWVGVTGGLPTETAKNVTAVLTHVEDGRSFDEDILSAMHDAIPPEKQVERADAEAVVTARLEDLELNQHSKDRLSITIEASMKQAWQGDDATTKVKKCKYEYDTQKMSAKDWLASDGIEFRTSINQGIGTIAGWMNRDLEAFAAATEFKKTKETPRSCFRRRHWYDMFLLF